MEKTITISVEDLEEIQGRAERASGDIQINNLENAKMQLAGIWHKVQGILDSAKKQS